MDPLTALSLVGNVISIVEFTAKLTTEAHEFVQSSSDALPRSEWIEEVAKQNKELAEQLATSVVGANTVSKSATAMVKLAQRCQDESENLIALLDPLKLTQRPDGTKSRAQAVLKVMRTKMKGAEIETSHAKLERLERQLSTLLLYNVRQTQAQEFEDLKALIPRTSGNTTDVVLRVKDELLLKITNSLDIAQVNVEDSLARVEQRLLNVEDRNHAEHICDSLRFPEMHNRKHAIEDKHRKSFSWILQEAKTPFRSWLATDSGVFWVCGSPGSGKSTMMKYITEERAIQTLLQTEWAKHRHFVMADFYFWIAGQPLQRSIRGMLQTLLYGLLSALPALIPTACPTIWALPAVRAATFSNLQWSKQVLLEAFDKLGAEPDICICLFIDGLDECEERQQQELIEVLTHLSNLENVKLCFSSRQWPVFERPFGSLSTKLALQTLTRDDIRNYVVDRLHSTDDEMFPSQLADGTKQAIMQKLLSRQKNTVSLSEEGQFINDVVDKADGIFLYASVLLDAICSRLAGGETLDELRKVLLDFPKKLEDYFENQVFARIAETYLGTKISETAMALQIALHVIPASRLRWGIVAPQSFIDYWLLSKSVHDSQGMLMQPEFGVAQDYLLCSAKDLRQMAIKTQKYLAVSCKDILHVPNWDKCLSCPNVSDIFYNIRVDFTHRIVFDFLTTERMQTVLRDRVPAHFMDKGEFLWQLTISRLKVRPSTIDAKYASYVLGEVESAFFEDQSSAGRSLDPTLDSMLTKYVREVMSYDDSLVRTSWHNLAPVIWNFVRRGQYHLANLVLDQHPGVAVGKITLLAAACGLSGIQADLTSDRVAIIRRLLQYGADPNASTLRVLTPHFNLSNWHIFLVRLLLPDNTLTKELRAMDVGGVTTPARHSVPDMQGKFDIVSVFIEHGADLRSAVCISRHDASGEHDLYKGFHTDGPNCEWWTVLEILRTAFPAHLLSRLQVMLEEYQKPDRQQEVKLTRLRRIAPYDRLFLYQQDVQSIAEFTKNDRLES